MLRFMLVAVSFCSIVSAQITTDLADWTLGTNVPVIATGSLPDMSTGDYINVPIGTSPFYYEVMEEGEGMVEMWVHDPGNCISATDNGGAGARGPKWGLQTGSYVAVVVGIDRASYVAYCQGYSPWSTAAPYSPIWFQGGVRDSSYVGGWYKWQITGGWDNIVFNYDDGRAEKTYNAIDNANWAAAFGDGWLAFHMRGDASNGVEPIKLHCTGGTGVFAGIDGTSSVSSGYERDSWANIKQLFR